MRRRNSNEVQADVGEAGVIADLGVGKRYRSPPKAHIIDRQAV
jgi:hypothetical protein